MKLSEGPGYQSAYYTTSGTKAVKAGTGVLRGFFLTVTVASAVTFNDSVGTKFALPASFPVGVYHNLDILFSGKIEAVLAGNSAITIIYS